MYRLYLLIPLLWVIGAGATFGFVLADRGAWPVLILACLLSFVAINEWTAFWGYEAEENEEDQAV